MASLEMANVTSATMVRVHAHWRGAPAPRTLQLCLNRCRRARNGRCEDRASAGGQQQQLPPTSSTACREGMDCSDCGVRTIRQPTGERSPRRRIAAWRRWVAPAVLSDVCLCTLMTADRVPSLHRLARSWGHLLSVAYLADRFEEDAARGFELLRLEGTPVPHEGLLTLSVVEDRGYRTPRNRFPFNLLRNVAVSASVADFVCLVDVDFVAYPAPSLGCAECAAAAKLRRWLPVLRVTPHLALVLPAFDLKPGGGAEPPEPELRTKRDLAERVAAGRAEPFAFAQYPMGHACDRSARWLHADAPYATPYVFGCEPYLVYNRRAAPKLWELFVAYGKDRVSFTYELAARGFVFAVLPDAFLVHHTTYARTQAGATDVTKYGHAPHAWMIGETCWPDFENRVHLKYHYRTGWCAQTAIAQAVNLSVVNGSLLCVAQLEKLCVLNCRPSLVRWQGQRVRVLRRDAARNASRAAAAAAAGEDAADEAIGAHTSTVSALELDIAAAGGATHSPLGARALAALSRPAAAASLRVPGTAARPPKAAQPFVYPLAKRDGDRRECCRVSPVEAKCNSVTAASTSTPTR